MAESDKNMDIRVLKRTKISVYVDEALPDILVVTYEYGVKIFKGVLLDSTKRNLPCGIETINPAFNVKPNPDDDSLYSANQRYAYTNPETAKKKQVSISQTKQKKNKMTVRLRPRQVLCTKCKGICNENSENVGRKRKVSDSIPAPPKRGANAPVTRSSNLDAINKRKLNTTTKVDDVDNLSNISTALSGNINKLNIDNNAKKPFLTVSNLNTKLRSSKQIEVHSTEHSDCSNGTTETIDTKQTKTNGNSNRSKRLLKKRRHDDEDSLDNNLEENSNKSTNNNTNSESSNSCSSTRTIKISYGPQGEGTVLKIPTQIESLNVTDEVEENVVETECSKFKNKDSNNKAARRALKKAKREARRKFYSNNSPNYGGNISPRLSGSSPRYMVEGVSTRHALGNNSPRYISATAYELNIPRRRKHKMKHKKKHREDRKHKEGDINLLTLEEAAREQCITQKLSINLKRLNNTYTSYQSNNDKAEESSSDEQSEKVPDFPPPNPPLILRVNAKTVSSAFGVDGGRLLVGDVVWGKIHGFPWWPGKVLTITNSENETAQAHVAWYGSSTSSLMQCDQLCPYLDHFKTRYNKKKRGPYKEAIRQAMSEARENAENRLRDSVVGSPVRNLITAVSPALASPREIDVVS